MRVGNIYWVYDEFVIIHETNPYWTKVQQFPNGYNYYLQEDDIKVAILSSIITEIFDNDN